MSITQENLENITFGRLDYLLRYVGTSPANDLVQGELCRLLEDFQSQQTDVELYVRLVSRLEAIGWQASQIKKVIDMLAVARQKEREGLRARVAVSYNPAFVSGLQTASRVLEMGSGKLLQAWIFTNGTNNATIDFFDSPDITDVQNSGHLLRVSCQGGNLENCESLKEELFFTSLTAILTGAGASYSVLYRTLERGKGE